MENLYDAPDSQTPYSLGNTLLFKADGGAFLIDKKMFQTLRSPFIYQWLPKAGCNAQRDEFPTAHGIVNTVKQLLSCKDTGSDAMHTKQEFNQW